MTIAVDLGRKATKPITIAISLLAATYHLLITFANSLDPDQDRQNVGPDLGSNRLTLC